MRLLTIFFTMFFLMHGGPCAHAGNFFAVGKQDAKTVYAGKGKCEKAEGVRCYDISQCVPEVCELEEYLTGVPAKNSPVINEQPCADEDSCAQQMGQSDYCANDELGFYGDRDGDESLESWCVKQAKDKRLAVDEAKKQARQEAREQARRVKLQRVQDLNQCRDSANMNVAELHSCLRKLLAHILGE